MDILRFLLAIVIVLILSIIIKRSKTLDNKGILASAIMGFFLIYFCGFKFFLILLSFFVLCSLASRLGKEKKKKLKNLEVCRGLKNVLANGLPPLIFAILYLIGFNFGLVGYVASIASATSDTFSSEIGILSNEKPRLITTFKEVKEGEDGGITLLGLLAGLLGSFLIGVVGFILFNDFKLLVSSTIAGFLGNIVDSYIGATLERKKIVNNEITNFLANLLGGIFGIILYFLF
ncbi:TIGR00297 family protein [Methanocaldococcus indicus]|uniref:TIGR00297 family protein n=1 Tax=Methanocaldococcus indicus TaxID=213231 RepID=UPI003C6D53F7